MYNFYSKTPSTPKFYTLSLHDALPIYSQLVIPGTDIPLFEHAVGNIRTVDSDYFRTMGISLQSGRMFTDADQQRQVAVISMSIARRAWPGEDPIGKRFHFGPPRDRKSTRLNSSHVSISYA